MKRLLISAAILSILAVPLIGCGSPKVVRAIGVRLERGIEISEQNGTALIDGYKDARLFAIKEHRRAVLGSLGKAKIVAAGQIPASLIAKLMTASVDGKIPPGLVAEFQAAKIEAAGSIPAELVAGLQERLDKNDVARESLSTDIDLKRKLHLTNSDEMRKALALIYQASEAWGDEETVNARIDELSGMVRLLLQTYAAERAKAAKP